jgi:multiple sugar transport system permease protein
MSVRDAIAAQAPRRKLSRVVDESVNVGPMMRSMSLYVLAALTILLLLFPIGWMISTAFKPSGDVFLIPPRWIPTEPTLDAFREALEPEVLGFFFNSIVVACASSLFATLTGALTAYAMSRLPFAGTQYLMIFFLASLAFPIPLLMITIYIIFRSLGLLDTYFVLVLTHTVITLPIVIWLMKDFFDNVPVEIEESAMIDGAGPWRTLFVIVMPMVKPGLAAASIFVFVTSWNEFIFGWTFTTSMDMRPLPAGISMKFLMEYQYKWPEMMAVAIVATVPILALFVLAQKYFFEGITAGAVKE